MKTEKLKAAVAWAKKSYEMDGAGVPESAPGLDGMRWEQSSWYANDREHCGTFGCLAGWIVYSEHKGQIPHDIVGEDFAYEAARILDVAAVCLLPLFHASNDIEDIEEIAAELIERDRRGDLPNFAMDPGGAEPFL